ncbi:uncharacterized protein LOC143024094 isoform X9 [Oratosquilla oratoria]|uniref:uncharacterized protein LOC143024094 isoform X9 n=1 Tax=Oratosquilla oratoria TaxID=337810 RepID=UPI003F75B328
MSLVPLMSPESGIENGSAVVRPPQSKMDSIKTWSITTYKCMHQPTHLRETGQARAHVPLTQQNAMARHLKYCQDPTTKNISA